MTRHRTFHFQQFSVTDHVSAHKVGLDSVLLGSWAPFDRPDQILDIGAGCGILSLMMAQRFPRSTCIAVEIDQDTAHEGSGNFERSSWSDRLTMITASIQDYVYTATAHSFDAVISNPPYFDHSLINENLNRSIARHDLTLSKPSLFQCVSTLLSPKGQFCTLLPSAKVAQYHRTANACGLYLRRWLEVKHSVHAVSKFSLILMDREPRGSYVKEKLIIGVQGAWTSDFSDLTDGFYLKAKGQNE